MITVRFLGVFRCVGLALLLCCASTGFAQGMSEEEALSLTADLVLIRYANSVDQCEAMGAKNMSALYDALRQLDQLRLESVPVRSTKFIENAKAGYRVGLAGLPKPEVTKADHIALICERTKDKIENLDKASFQRIVANSVQEYGVLFAQAR